jgi:hypothetical protein
MPKERDNVHGQRESRVEGMGTVRRSILVIGRRTAMAAAVAALTLTVGVAARVLITPSRELTQQQFLERLVWVYGPGDCAVVGVSRPHGEGTLTASCLDGRTASFEAELSCSESLPCALVGDAAACWHRAGTSTPSTTP